MKLPAASHGEFNPRTRLKTIRGVGYALMEI